MPAKFEIIPGQKPEEATLILEPCFYGYGTTVGQALRRVLLSSLPGAAVTAVKIKGVQHEFSSLPLVKEDVLQIILNLKLLRLRLFSDEPVRLMLRVKGEKEVRARDFEKNSAVEIVNPELLLATLTDKKAELEMEITAERGRGYLPSEARRERPSEIGFIMIDALFSPVRKVGYRVENTRVGEITNYDRLIMNIETDGTLSPEEAVRESSKILLDYFSLFLEEKKDGAILGEGIVSDLAPEAGTEIESVLPARIEAQTEIVLKPEEGSGLETAEEKPKKRGRKKTIKKK